MELRDFFAAYPRAAIALSGGADSAYLLYGARAWGEGCTAYHVHSAFQPAFELEDAKRLCRDLEVPLRVLEVDLLSSPAILKNDDMRCYHCKKRMFTAIAQAAAEEGYALLLDGTNASDREGDRPGMQALRELSVRSPLRECGLTKGEIRQLSRQAGLFTWDKPAYACLATRIPAGEAITAEKLERTERGEAFLASLGFTDFRIRMEGEAARIQLRQEQLPALLRQRCQVLAGLKSWYRDILLDLEGRP